jgi:hypothetical protein
MGAPKKHIQLASQLSWCLFCLLLFSSLLGYSAELKQFSSWRASRFWLQLSFVYAPKLELSLLLSCFLS